MCVTLYEIITQITISQTTLENRILKIDSKFEKLFSKPDSPESSPKGRLICVTDVCKHIVCDELIKCVCDALIKCDTHRVPRVA